VIVTLNPDVVTVISSDNLDSEGLIEIEGNMVDAYSSISISAGESFSITVAGYRSSGIDLLWIGTGVLIILGIGGGVYAFRSSRKSIEQLMSDEDTLTSKLEQIEKDFINKNINELEYLKLKLKNKTTLEKIRSSIQEQEKVKKNS
jgi:hypothetical protein